MAKCTVACRVLPRFSTISDLFFTPVDTITVFSNNVNAALICPICVPLPWPLSDFVHLFPSLFELTLTDNGTESA